MNKMRANLMTFLMFNSQFDYQIITNVVALVKEKSAYSFFCRMNTFLFRKSFFQKKNREGNLMESLF